MLCVSAQFSQLTANIVCSCFQILSETGAVNGKGHVVVNTERNMSEEGEDQKCVHWVLGNNSLLLGY